MMIILIYVYLISGAHVKASAVFLYVAGFSFLIVDGVYLMWSLLANNFELIGPLTIGLSGLMCVMFAFYFGRVLKSSVLHFYPRIGSTRTSMTVILNSGTSVLGAGGPSFSQARSRSRCLVWLSVLGLWSLPSPCSL
jgi:hypothetical protein